MLFLKQYIRKRLYQGQSPAIFVGKTPPQKLRCRAPEYKVNSNKNTVVR